MAKKVVATFQKGENKHLSRIIRSIRSPKTGAYTFKEEIVPTDKVKELLAHKV